ncbi:unnamed protein product [Miscanthus lutarioriparius]|uniref:Uncharacterized protein n=1 Tax=Miscanthus lutarioriparius TaxID=422564 RepID=A0A811PFT1_9POAL|nr:unnamed protein product [Miscanthus lutarioriparius]
MLIPAQSAPPPFSSLRSLSSHYILFPSHFLPPGGVVLPPLRRRGDLAIRMGGGPRTYPGGVSKWQWKRMQAKKARQLLKARLARERQLYEMRKRAELRDAVAHLERPWDPDSSSSADQASAVAPNLLSVAAEDQLRALADRFHRPGGVDLWNDRDGPRVFASPATGAASARFFPRNAFHSIQPYALVSAGGEASAPRGSAQGVRENAAEDEAYSGIADHEPAVELTERDGTWEPVNALSDADDSIAGDWTSDDDDDDDDNDAISESKDIGDVGSWHEQGTVVRRNGRSNGVARWEAAGAMAAGSNSDRGWSGNAFFSDSEGAREGHREKRWQERSSGASPRKQASGRWTGLKTTAGSHVRQRGRTGAGSFSESEVIRGGSEPKWRASKGKKDDTGNGAGRWNAPKRDWMGDGFDSESDSARGREMEPRRGARNKMNGRDSLRGRSKPNYSANANGGEKLLKYLKGDTHANSSSGFAEDLEAPKWKPRRTNRARNNSGGRDDDMGGRFRRGEDGRKDGGRKTSRNGGTAALGRRILATANVGIARILVGDGIG